MNLFERVREAVATTLEVPQSEISETTAADELVAWDSLAHVNLMLTLEQTFDVTLEVEDFARLNSVPRILDYLKQHGAEA